MAPRREFAYGFPRLPQPAPEPSTLSAIRYLLAVDGGGTSCRARLADLSGAVLGEGRAGSANLTAGVEPVRAEVLAAAAAAYTAAGLDAAAMAASAACLGLAGANASGLGESFLATPFPFGRIRLVTDAEIACRGAHRGGDGGILVLGTGSQGVVAVGGRLVTVGGWGFALSDGGSGAVVGRAALRRALLAHEDLSPASDFTRAVMARFDDRPQTMLAFALKAAPRDWAAFAPLVFEAAAAGDPVARGLADEAAGDVAALVGRVRDLGARSIALMGGLAAFYRPMMPAPLVPLLAEPAGDALDGALALARAMAAD